MLLSLKAKNLIKYFMVLIQSLKARDNLPGLQLDQALLTLNAVLVELLILSGVTTQEKS